MKLTEGQLRHILHASTQRGDTATVRAGVGDFPAVPRQKISDVILATEEVIRAADNVIRAAHAAAPASEMDMAASPFADQGPVVEQRQFSPLVPIAQPTSPYRRTLVRSAVASSVLLVAAVVVGSMLLKGGRSVSSKLEESGPPTTARWSEPGMGKAAADAPDRPSMQANPSGTRAPLAGGARTAGAGADSPLPPNTGLSAVATAPAPAELARPAATPQTARRGASAPGNAGSAGNTIGAIPQAQARGAARVATFGSGETGPGGSPTGLPSQHQKAPAVGTAPGSTAVPVHATSAALTACLAARPPALRLPQAETARLFQRGEEYMGEGRISAARALFQRAADACDMKAAFALGATYDPIMLRKLGVALFDPNIATARAWYEQAKRLGLSEASHQLELLSELNQ